MSPGTLSTAELALLRRAGKADARGDALTVRAGWGMPRVLARNLEGFGLLEAWDTDNGITTYGLTDRGRAQLDARR